MVNFLGKLSLPKTARRFVIESVYGLQARQSVRLTEIGRALNEPNELIQTVKRLSNQLGREGLNEAITDHVVRHSAHKIGDKTLLVVDPSDITKKYARAMENLAHIRDGSTGRIEEGYWFCSVIGVECDGQEITPLCNRLWSQKSPDFESENKEIMSCIDPVASHLSGQGIWVMDRGGDRSRFYELLLNRGLSFIIRMIGNRHLLYNGKSILTEDLAHRCSLPYTRTVIKQGKDGKELVFRLKYGVMKVELPSYPGTPLRLVVIEGFGKKPMMILTTEPVRKRFKEVDWILRAYLTRWRIEDTIRFAKQSYQLEDVRVLSYKRLQNMMGIVLAAMSFTMTRLNTEIKLSVLCDHALKAGKRLFGIPDFRYYALADGIKELLSMMKKPLRFRPTSDPNDPQLYLPDLHPS